MLHDVFSAVHQGVYLIELEFDDGQRGTVDFAKYLERRAVFERFRDLEFFRSFAIKKRAWGPDVGQRDRHSTGDLVCGGYRDPSSRMDEFRKIVPGERGLQPDSALGRRT